MKKIPILLLFFVTMVMVMMGCQRPSKGTVKPVVAVTLPPQKFFVESIAGGVVDVVVMVPTGSSPEEYDPSPRNIMDLEGADLYFYIGTLPYETRWLETIARSAKPARTVNLSEALPHDLTCTHDHGEGYKYESVHPMGDPHYWTSVLAGKLIADMIYKSLCESFPEHKATFEANYKLLQEQINTLAQRALDIFVHYNTQRAFVIYHPSLSVFSEEWGLTQLVIEQKGKQPTPFQLAQLLEDAKTKNATVVIIQQEYDTETTESIAKELSLPTHVINPLEENWLHQMNTLLDAFDTAKR